MDILANLWKLKETGASTLNGVTDAERKRAIFLSVIGSRTYKLLSSLTVARNKPGEKTYDSFLSSTRGSDMAESRLLLM